MKILYRINDFFDFKISTFLLLLLSFLTGQFKTILIFLAISFIHECGHLMMCLLFKVKVLKINVLPFGFNLETKDKIKVKSYQEALIYFAGPAMYFLVNILLRILKNKFLISSVSFNFAMNANLVINLFNLLPIYPLDGFRIVNSFLQLFLPYKKTLKYSLFFSLFFTTGLIIYNFYNFQIVVTIFIILMQVKYIKEIPLLYQTFLIDKTFFKKHKKFKLLKDYNMYKDKNNYHLLNNKIMNDADIAWHLLKKNKNK